MCRERSFANFGFQAPQFDCRYQWLNATHEVTLKIPFHRAEEKRHGFILAIIPKVNKPKQEIAGMEIIAVERVEDTVAKMR